MAIRDRPELFERIATAQSKLESTFFGDDLENFTQGLSKKKTKPSGDNTENVLYTLCRRYKLEASAHRKLATAAHKRFAVVAELGRPRNLYYTVSVLVVVGVVIYGVAGCGANTSTALHQLAANSGIWAFSLPEGTSINAAKTKVLRTFPTDTRVLSFRVLNICAIMRVHSATLGRGLSHLQLGDGTVDVEFNNSSEGTTHTVYDPANIDSVLVDPQIDSTGTSLC